MTLLSRIKDIVRANINDLVTKAEDPEKSLNLYIEDAMEHLREFGVEVNRFGAEHVMLQKQIQECEAAATDWHQQAKLALDQGREDLARTALDKEQKENERLAKLKPQLESAAQAAAQMKEQYQLLQDKLAEAKEKRDDLVRRNRLAVAQKGASDAIRDIDMDDPLSKFDRMEEKIERREAEGQAAYNTMTSSYAYEMDQLKKSQADSKVDDALAKLKEKMNHK